MNPTYRLANPEAQVYVGDCCELLPKLDARPDLIIADPPYNFGQDYQGYDDRMPFWQYRDEWLPEWIGHCAECLKPGGALWLVVPDGIIIPAIEAASRGGLFLKAWCLWHFRFGQWQDAGFITSKVHLPWFVKDLEAYVWNPDAVLVPSDRASTYNDKRTDDTAQPGRRVPLDIWGIPSDGPFWGRVQGNNAERSPDHPNQLPERLVERIIRACSNPDHLVLDPFLGSGTTSVVARALCRRSIGIEISPASAASAVERINRGAVRVTSGPARPETSSLPRDQGPDSAGAADFGG